ncbi:MAG: hypothetical protein LBH04_01725 [Tannerellaceae bacterium]|jgi:hypothetical protein|nr:hypothetical protein [Tannerellaceae bacterium]
MITRRFFALLVIAILLGAGVDAAAQAWRDRMDSIIYSPRYFGPSAFPIPELRAGKVPTKFELEVRGEYHYFAGDSTTDVFLKALLPIVRGKAALEICFIPWEDYRTSQETADERNASSTGKGDSKYTGDVVISALFQLLESDKWLDMLLYFGIKTASGGRLGDARFTDAATYWIGMDAGKLLASSSDGRYFLRLQAASGFYCWMTNDRVHRQNDAWSYGAGIAAGLNNVSISSDFSGFHGYENNGDKPLIWRNCIQFDFRNNVISFRYNHGLRDFLYDTYSIGLIRKF